VRYFIELSYSGKAYNGWQVQPDAPSVQQTLQKALSTILRTETEVVGAGRTDTGVHARRYIAHFDTDEAIGAPQDFCYHLNSVLPHDIAVSSVARVKDDAHARFDAVSREYKYYISTKKDPFLRDFAYILTIPLHVQLMNEAAAAMKEYSDFTSFSKLHSNNKTNTCHIYEAFWQYESDLLVFTVSADRFLRNMVRAIVGTLIDVGRGKVSAGGFREIIEGRDRGLAGTSAPPQGLFLTNIVYPPDVFIM